MNWQPLFLEWINAAEINKQLFHFSDVQTEVVVVVVVVFQLIQFLFDTAGASSRSGMGKPRPAKISHPAC